ncbi:MAG: FecR domain-containing protein, partial [Victivallaceae bacterium]
LIKFIIPAAACLVIAAGLLALFFSGRMQNGRAGIKNQKAEACLLVSTPGGLITRQGQQQAITNGTKIYTDDTIKTFASSTAFMQFNDLSRIEIGSGSIIKYDGTRVLKAPGNKTENKITVALEDGAIYGDIVRNSDYGSFTVTTSQGKILTQDGKFILISTGQLFYLEVTAGTVHFKGNAEAGSVKLTAGQICTAQNGQPEIIAKARLAALPVSSEIAMNRKRLTLDDSGLERLLVKLYKQKKVDICLRSRHRTNRLFL